MVELSIIIVNWNTRELLAQCLASIEAHPPDAPYEVWVVDNASADGSAAMVRERFPEVRLIENATNVGFAVGNNQAILESRGEYTLLLNPDTEVRPGALNALLAFMEVHPRAGAAGARLVHADGRLQYSCHPMLTPAREFWRLLFLDRLWPRATYPMGRWDPAVPRQVDVIQGACLLLRRKAVHEVGLLDESYFMYTEEVDLCYRLHKAGWERWWVPRAQVIHYGARSTRQVAEEMYMQLYCSKVRFYRKYCGESLASRFKRMVRLAYWPRFVAATLLAPLSAAARARRHTYGRLLAELPQM